MFPETPSLPPSDLRSMLPNHQSPWMVSEAVFKRLSPFSAGTFRQCEIQASDPEWAFIYCYFSAHKPMGKSIAKAYCVHNATQHQKFECQLSTLEAESTSPHFAPKWSTDDPHSLRKKVMKRWAQLTTPYSPCTVSNRGRDTPLVNTKVIPLWHGTKEDTCRSVCTTGFTTFGKHKIIQEKKKDKQNTDIGYFGSGIYFTTSANYAATIYSDGNLLLTWVSMREPYPVIADKPHPDKPSDMKKLEGLHAYENYSAHYIPVVSIQPDNPSCGVYYPCTDTQDPVFDEIVVFNTAQTLPRFWIQLGPEMVTSLAPPVYDLTHLLALADQEVIKQMEWMYQENKKFPLKHCVGNKSFLFEVVSKRRLALLEWLHKEDAQFIVAKGEDGKTLLHEAAGSGATTALEWLLKQEPRLISAFRNNGETPLHCAAAGGHLECVQLLLKEEPQLISQFREDGWTPLHAAAAKGHVEVALRLLKESKELILQFTHDKWTALHVAAKRGHVEMGKRLCEQEPNLLNCVNEEGETPLMVAEQYEHKAFVAWIESVGGTRAESCSVM